MLHITNGDCTRVLLERSGVPGAIASWDDVLHEGPVTLTSGDEWLRARVRYLASAGYGDEEEMLRDCRAKGDPLEAADAHDEVVFWFEHDLHCQLLLMHHLWWLAQHRAGSEDPAGERPRVSIVMGAEHLGLLKPEDYPSRFAGRRPIDAAEIDAGAAAWTAFCGDDPRRLVPFARDAGPLVHLPRAMHRLLEEFPAPGTGLGRSERQILEVLSEGPRTPGQTFVECAKREEDVWMGDWSFWTIVQRLAGGAQPLVTADVRREEDRFPEGTLTISGTGRRVLAGGADYMALSPSSRWIGGTCLTPERWWRWTGAAVLPASP
jgi:hypothetical protein